MGHIKVLHILHSFGIGGMEKGIAMLINGASEDIQHSILCLAQTGESRHLIPSDIPIWEMHKSPENSFGFILKLASRIREIGPDVVHTRNWGGMDGVIAARLAGVKAVVHGEHGWGMDDPQGQSKKRRVIRRLLSRGIREQIAVSQWIATWLRDEVRVPRPVTQIYNGVELKTALNPPEQGWLKRELGLSTQARLIGTVGRLDPIKDHAGLMKAFRPLREAQPDAHLLIVGDGPERGILESKRFPGVHLLGMRGDVSSILKELDIFVLSSLNEGISNTVLEAMAAGLPVVATEVGGNPELIVHEKNGLLVKARDYPAMAQAMARYLDDAGLCRSHGAQSRRIIDERFSISAMVQSYENVWRRVANK